MSNPLQSVNLDLMPEGAPKRVIVLGKVMYEADHRGIRPVRNADGSLTDPTDKSQVNAAALARRHAEADAAVPVEPPPERPLSKKTLEEMEGGRKTAERYRLQREAAKAAGVPHLQPGYRDEGDGINKRVLVPTDFIPRFDEMKAIKKKPLKNKPPETIDEKIAAEKEAKARDED